MGAWVCWEHDLTPCPNARHREHLLAKMQLFFAREQFPLLKEKHVPFVSHRLASFEVREPIAELLLQREGKPVFLNSLTRVCGRWMLPLNGRKEELLSPPPATNNSQSSPSMLAHDRPEHHCPSTVSDIVTSRPPPPPHIIAMYFNNYTARPGCLSR